MTYQGKTKGIGIGAWTPRRVGEAMVGAGAVRGAGKLGRAYMDAARETAKQIKAGVELAQQKLQERELSRIKTERGRRKGSAGAAARYGAARVRRSASRAVKGKR